MFRVVKYLGVKLVISGRKKIYKNARGDRKTIGK